MTKRLSAITGEYNDKQTGQQKAEWTNIGVILQAQSGKEYMLLDPAVSLSGVLAKQNALAMKKNEPIRDNVMVSLIDENQQQSQNNHQQQAPQQNQYQGGQQQGGGYGQQQAPQQQSNNYNPNHNPNDPSF